MILNILLITALIGCALDIISTYQFLKGKDYNLESNVIFRNLFKFLGTNITIVIAALISIYICLKIYLHTEIGSEYKIGMLLFVTITKTAVAYDNYRSKKGWISKLIVFMIPIYWNWKAIGNKIKSI